jgi:hypothetical protein
MLFEYKIQKIEDGNGEERFDIKAHKVSDQKWWKRKQWSELDRYGSDTSHATLGAAQSVVKKQMDSDARTEYRENQNKTKVIKEFFYTEIPNHIPEDQEEKFCDLSEVKV